MNLENNAALQGAITFYSCSAFKVLYSITLKEEQKLSEAVVDFTGEVAPYKNKNGEFPTRELPVFGKTSIIKALAIGGSILVKNQIEAEWKEHIKSMNNNILSWCVDGWEMYQLLEGNNKNDGVG